MGSSSMAPVICYVFYVIFNNLILFLVLLCLFSFNNSNQSIMIMQSCASVVSGTALASLAVVTASVVSSELSAKANPWIPAGRPINENLSNVDDTVDSGITKVV